LRKTRNAAVNCYFATEGPRGTNWKHKGEMRMLKYRIDSKKKTPCRSKEGCETRIGKRILSKRVSLNPVHPERLEEGVNVVAKIRGKGKE